MPISFPSICLPLLAVLPGLFEHVFQRGPGRAGGNGQDRSADASALESSRTPSTNDGGVGAEGAMVGGLDRGH